MILLLINSSIFNFIQKCKQTKYFYVRIKFCNRIINNMYKYFEVVSKYYYKGFLSIKSKNTFK